MVCLKKKKKEKGCFHATWQARPLQEETQHGRSENSASNQRIRNGWQCHLVGAGTNDPEETLTFHTEFSYSSMNPCRLVMFSFYFKRWIKRLKPNSLHCKQNKTKHFWCEKNIDSQPCWKCKTVYPARVTRGRLRRYFPRTQITSGPLRCAALRSLPCSPAVLHTRADASFIAVCTVALCIYELRQAAMCKQR